MSATKAGFFSLFRDSKCSDDLKLEEQYISQRTSHINVEFMTLSLPGRFFFAFANEIGINTMMSPKE